MVFPKNYKARKSQPRAKSVDTKTIWYHETLLYIDFKVLGHFQGGAVKKRPASMNMTPRHYSLLGGKCSETTQGNTGVSDVSAVSAEELAAALPQGSCLCLFAFQELSFSFLSLSFCLLWLVVLYSSVSLHIKILIFVFFSSKGCLFIFLTILGYEGSNQLCGRSVASKLRVHEPDTFF